MQFKDLPILIQEELSKRYSYHGFKSNQVETAFNKFLEKFENYDNLDPTAFLKLSVEDMKTFISDDFKELSHIFPVSKFDDLRSSPENIIIEEIKHETPDENIKRICSKKCVNFKVKKPSTGGRYESGQARCQICDIWIDFRGAKLKNGAKILLYKVNDPEAFGVAKFDEKNKKIKMLKEKPKKFFSNNAVTGLYFFDNRVIDYAKNLKP